MGKTILPPTSLQPGQCPIHHLSLDEVVTLTLRQDLDLRVERIHPRIHDLSIAKACSVYTATLSTTCQRST